MAGITAAGSASGMDFESIIMASVQAKAAQLNKQTALKKEETKVILSGVGKLKNALETFKKSIDALTKDNGFNVRKVTVDQPQDNPFFTVSTKDDAASGNYDVVVKQLATSTKLEQEFGKDDKFGPGKFTITLPPLKNDDGTYQVDEDGKPKERKIEIDLKEEVTIEGLRKKINDNDFGVTASIITLKDGKKKLVIDSGITGAITDEGGKGIKPIKIEVTSDNENLKQLEFAGNTSDKQGWNKVTAGQDAKIEIDGQELTSNTNQFNNISGITITANRVSESEKDSSGGVNYKSNKLTIEQDDDAITKKVEDFVNAYNTLQSAMSDLGKNNTFSDGKNNYDGGDLAGDSMLRTLSNQLQSLMTSFKSSTSELDIYSIGLEVDKDGVFKLDSAKFKENISDNFNAVVKIFTQKDESKPEEGKETKDGLLIKLNNIIEKYTKSDGILSNREDELNEIIKGYEEKETRNAELIEAYEASLRQKYAKLDNTIAGYNNSLSYLQSALV